MTDRASTGSVIDDCYDAAERRRGNDFYSADRDGSVDYPPDLYHGYAADHRHVNGFYVTERAGGVHDGGIDPPDSYDEYAAEQRRGNDLYSFDNPADGVDPDSYDGYEVKPHATDSRDVTTPRLSYDGGGADHACSDLNVSDITNSTVFEDENRNVATPSFSYNSSGVNRNQIDSYSEETADQCIFAEENGTYDTDNIDELLEEMRAGSEHAKDSDIYSILEQLEEDMRQARQITKA